MYNVQWSPGVTLEQVERQVIETAFSFYKNNKSQTARALDIAVRTLETKLEKYEKDDAAGRASLDEARKRREDFLKRQRGIPAGVQSYNGVDIGNARFDESSSGVEAQSGNSAAPGVRMESASESSEEPSVSVPVREEVQELPSSKASTNRSRKAR